MTQPDVYKQSIDISLILSHTSAGIAQLEGHKHFDLKVSSTILLFTTIFYTMLVYKHLLSTAEYPSEYT